MITAIIDVGSNTIRLSIFQHESDGSLFSLVSKKRIVGLAGYIENGALSAQGEERLNRSLEVFLLISRIFGVSDIRAFATASLRYTSNAKEVIQHVYERCGLQIELLSGMEEARLSFLGAEYSTGINDGLVVDIGGGSCELVRVKDKQAEHMVSLPLGSLALTIKSKTIIFPQQNSVDYLTSTIDHLLNTAETLFEKKTSTLCFVGGTARGANRVARQINPKMGLFLGLKEIEKIIKGFEEQDERVMQAVRRAAPERVFTLYAGMLIMHETIKASRAETILISSCGVREGYLIDKVIR